MKVSYKQTKTKKLELSIGVQEEKFNYLQLILALRLLEILHQYFLV